MGSPSQVDMTLTTDVIHKSAVNPVLSNRPCIFFFFWEQMFDDVGFYIL